MHRAVRRSPRLQLRARSPTDARRDSSGAMPPAAPPSRQRSPRNPWAVASSHLPRPQPPPTPASTSSGRSRLHPPLPPDHRLPPQSRDPGCGSPVPRRRLQPHRCRARSRRGRRPPRTTPHADRAPPIPPRPARTTPPAPAEPRPYRPRSMPLSAPNAPSPDASYQAEPVHHSPGSGKVHARSASC